MDVNKLQKPKIHSGGLGEVYYNSFEDLKNAFDNSKGSEVDKTKYFKKVFIYDALKVDDFKKTWQYENETALNKGLVSINETPADIINKIKYKEIIQELNLFEIYLNDVENRFLEPQQADQPQQEAKESKEVKYKTEYHVISYILDCKAQNLDLPISKKTEIEEDAKNRIKYKGSENTFYRKFNIHAIQEINKSYLIDLIGSDWQKIVLELSNDKDTLRNYLERHFV